MMDDVLRVKIAADLRPVERLAPPLRRTVALVPLALALLVAAPLAFDFRDLAQLGVVWSWGASLVQTSLGLAAVAIALREAVPGRELAAPRLWLALAGVVALFLTVTAAAWSANPVPLIRHWWQIGAMCAVGSSVSALPAVALSSVLIVRAFPLHPVRTGAIGGLGGGLLADAGWRLFCHFSEPGHVIAAHLGGIVFAAIAGAALTTWLVRR